LRENRKPWIFPWNMVFSCKISLKPIHWFPDSRKLGNNNPKFDDLESLDPFRCGPMSCCPSPSHHSIHSKFGGKFNIPSHGLWQPGFPTLPSGDST
jgi:hypothetical protein